MTLEDALTELDAAACTAWGEAAGEGYDGQVAVVWVLRNRASDGRHGFSIIEVALRPKQFSCWNEPSKTRVLARRLVNDEPLARYVELPSCRRAARDVLEGRVPDPTKGATHYYAPKAMDPPGRVPKWARGKKPCAAIGGHLFFNDVKW